MKMSGGAGIGALAFAAGTAIGAWSLAGAPLIEVEWAISRAVWESLAEWQRADWHPLAPAVEAGRVRLPDLPAAEEREMLGTVAGLYAQTFNLAGIEGALPTGLEGVAMATHLRWGEWVRAMGGDGAAR